MKFINSVLFYLLLIISFNLCYSGEDTDVLRLKNQANSIIAALGRIGLAFPEMKPNADKDILKIKTILDYAKNNTEGELQELKFQDEQGNTKTIDISEIDKYFKQLPTDYPDLPRFLLFKKRRPSLDLAADCNKRDNIEKWNQRINVMTKLSPNCPDPTTPNSPRNPNSNPFNFLPRINPDNPLIKTL